MKSALESYLDAMRSEVYADTPPRLSSTQLILHDFRYYYGFQDTTIFYEVIDNMCFIPTVDTHATPQPV